MIFIILIIFCSYVLISPFLLPIFFMNTEHLLDTLFKSMFFCALLMDVVNLVSFLHKISCKSKQSFSMIMVTDAYRCLHYFNITYGLLKVENLGKIWLWYLNVKNEKFFIFLFSILSLTHSITEFQRALNSSFFILFKH